jgi:prepilin-type N-terminal cleavage/methylation domain-containing protein
MSIASVQANRNRRSGFTLLEIILAVAILAMMALAIYRFVQSNLVAIRISSEASAADARYDGLRELLTAQWQSLAPGSGALTGEPLKLEDRPRDEIRWTCGPGPGLLTRYAPGDFVVTLRLQRENEKSNRLDLGILRKPKNDEGLSTDNGSWLPLIENVNSLEIRYFDPRLNSWLDRWADNLTLPRLVKVTIDRGGSTPPWEAVIALGRMPL